MPKSKPEPVTVLSREERDIARRWCILNSWGWPHDLPMPADEDARRAGAREQMVKAVRAVSLTKILTYWNSDDWRGTMVKQEYGR